MQRTPLPKKILIIFDFLFYFLNYLVLTVLIVLLFFLAKNSTFLVHRSVLQPPTIEFPLKALAFQWESTLAFQQESDVVHRILIESLVEFNALHQILV